MPWTTPKPNQIDLWSKADVTNKILGKETSPVPVDWASVCGRRLARFRDEMRQTWVGMDLPRDLGPLTDWLVAGMVARENILLIGPPGTAKTEMAVHAFDLLGLKQHLIEHDDLPPIPEGDVSQTEWWQNRHQDEMETHKYFHYLLTRFSQPEELFGPIEIALLRRGALVRINFGLLTGPGVRAVFLDEVFKASSAILNTLLTVTNERRHFNWGGMMRSDIDIFIAASNEMPGGFASGAAGVGAGGEDFQTLHAFLDRFPIRLQVPVLSAGGPSAENSDLGKAFDRAFSREARRFIEGAAFSPRNPVDMPSINDLLLLGRFIYQGFYQPADTNTPNPFDSAQRTLFRRAFLEIAADLRARGSTGGHRVSWTISPRKLKALYKIALAHALVRDDKFLTGSSRVIKLGPQDLLSFALIWDTPTEKDNLENHVRELAFAYADRLS